MLIEDYLIDRKIVKWPACELNDQQRIPGILKGQSAKASINDIIIELFQCYFDPRYL